MQFLVGAFVVLFILWLIAMLIWAVVVVAIRFFGLILAYSVLLGGIALLVGLVWAMISPIRVLRGRAKKVPVVASPAAVQGGAVTLRGPRGAAEHFGWDAAWPLYVPSQLGFDQIAVLAEMKRVTMLVGERSAGMRSAGSGWFIRLFTLTFWLVALVIPTFAFIVGAVLGTLQWLAITWLCRLFVATVQHLVSMYMSAREQRFMKKNYAAVRCTRCYRSTTMPSYLCSNDQCGTIHRDVSPGRLGIVSRICHCEARLPLTVRRASQKLTARCPFCEQSLPQGSGTRRVVVIPVFGSVGAGKTQFLAASAAALADGAGDLVPGTKITALNSTAMQFMQAAVAQLLQGQAPSKTQHVERPEGYPFLVEQEGTEFELHLMDAAGESFTESRTTSELRYLDIAHTLVYLFDPLTLPEVAGHLQRSSVATEVLTAQGYSGDSYGSVVDRLRDSGEDLRRRRLAIVVTKADVIEKIMPATPLAGSGPQVREWLNENGADWLTRDAELDFSQIDYFAVASTAGSHVLRDRHPLHVIDWSVRNHGGTSLFAREEPKMEEAR